MLRLVHPPSRGQGTDPPARRRGVPAPCLSLTPEEARHVRAAARNIARTRAFGSLRALAVALGVQPHTLTRKCRRPSAALAVALARIANVSVDSVLGRAGLAALPGGAS